MSYTTGKTMKRRFQKVKKAGEKLILGPKMSKNGCSLSVVVSYTVGNPHGKNIWTIQKEPKPGPVVTKNGCSLSVIGSYNVKEIWKT